MKKVSAKFLIGIIATVVLLSVVIGLIISIAFEAKSLVSSTILFGIIALFIICCILFVCFESVTDRFVNKTLEEGTRKENFGEYYTFYSGLSTIRIDENKGIIGYVSNLNPFEFQMISAKDIENIRSDYMKGPLGGTGYVYFEFWYHKKQFRVPTFTSNNVYSLSSSEVLEGISKADNYAQILQNAKANAR